MDALTTFGLFAVTMMLLCYALEERSPWFILAFAVACASSRAPGRSASLRRSGRSSRRGGGWTGDISIVTDGRVRRRSLFLRRPLLRIDEPKRMRRRFAASFPR